MMDIKAVIIDDERLARAELISLLKNHNIVNILGEATNATEGIALIKSKNPDVIFLDIQMPGINGFEMIKQLDEVPKVVFVTAYDEHAIEAFKVDAIDYLLKPVDPIRLEECINKIIKNFEEDSFDTSLGNNRKNRLLTKNDRVFIKDGEKCFFPKVGDIKYFESQGNYVRVLFDDNRLMLLRSLNSLEERLSPDDFFRANRKYIINLEHIVEIQNWFNGGLKVTLKDGEGIEISRRQAIKFREIMSL